ncbi:MAG: hypothetical protein RR161_01040 [Bacilli bacterium]
MLNKYEESQKEFVAYVKQAQQSNKISHAYLIETNGYINYKDLVIDFAKFLLCLEKNEEEIANIVHLIDNNVYSDLKMVKAEGLSIKKEQIMDLLDDYSKKSNYGGKRIYIIDEAYKLNKSSSNSLLKFLEDPYENTIGIMIVENRYQVIDTIRSRCQLLSLKSNDLLDDKEEKQRENIVNFLLQLIDNAEITLLNIDELYFAYFTTKNDIVNSFNLLQLLYNDIINLKFEHVIINFHKYSSQLKHISDMFTLKPLIKMENIISVNSQLVKNNANMNMLIDKIIIEIKGVIENDKNSGN